MQQQVYQTKIQDMDNLRQEIDGWTGMQQSITDDATGVSIIACGPEEDI